MIESVCVHCGAECSSLISGSSPKSFPPLWQKSTTVCLPCFKFSPTLLMPVTDNTNSACFKCFPVFLILRHTQISCFTCFGYRRKDFFCTKWREGVYMNKKRENRPKEKGKVGDSIVGVGILSRRTTFSQLTESLCPQLSPSQLFFLCFFSEQRRNTKLNLLVQSGYYCDTQS